MKKLFAIFIMLISGQLVNAQGQDPAYMSTFGYGVILASGKGLPAYATYDATQFDFKDNVFYVQPGENASFDFRVIYPKGTTCGGLLQKLKTEKPEGMTNHTGDFDCWKIWCSDNTMGESLITSEHPWPSKLTDEPSWSEPIAEHTFEANDANSSWSTCAMKWETIQWEIQSYLKVAKPGTKFYVTYSVGYSYEVPGGQVETKWNSDYNVWEQVVSEGMVGYVYSDPIAACTIEIK